MPSVTSTITFESASASDLYVLQKRAVVQEVRKDRPYFDTASPDYGPHVAVGMGVAGGAYAGRAAVNAQQIARKRKLRLKVDAPFHTFTEVLS